MKFALFALTLVALTACRERVAPPVPAPANIQVFQDLPAAGSAGAVVGSFSVRVTDASDRPVSGVLVSFAASIGAAQPTPVSDTTNAEGVAASNITLGTAPGQNQVTALVRGLAEAHSAIVLASAGEAHAVVPSQRLLRLTPAVDSVLVAATPRDRFGNLAAAPVTWTSRNPAVAIASSATGTTAYARVISRPGQAWLVATAGAASDSILVAVQQAGDSPCAFVTPPVELAVGASLALEGSGLGCVRSSESSEYVLVAHYGTPISSASATVALAAHGVVPLPLAVVTANSVATQAPPPELTFEQALREREARSISTWVPAAREWYRSRATTGMSALTAARREGDIIPVNVNAFDFCASPTTRSARVMAITKGTIMLEDTSNPAGGFTAEEYQAMAAAMDTLVLPVDTAAFGAPSDVDNNGRIGVLFTRAVNELTPRGTTNGVVLGFYYVRDLLPRASAAGLCPGSNVGEMFYLLVPDASGAVSAPRSKAFVQRIVLSTIAHELQHLINASRRMYVNNSPSVSEESWLNEGLSHIAEELLFYRASGLSPRMNIAAGSLVPGGTTRELYDQYMSGNFGRLAQYLQATESNSPLASNDDLATRGASWSFLRYVADRIGATDGDLWRRLANARTTGVVNLDAQLQGTGQTTMTAVRDWSVATFVDDNLDAPPPALMHPSWNYRSAMPQVGMSFGLSAPAMADGVAIPLPLRAGGSAYLRLAAQAGRDVLVQVTNGGGIPQPGVRLTLVRTR
jgi:hypothetical protein